MSVIPSVTSVANHTQTIAVSRPQMYGNTLISFSHGSYFSLKLERQDDAFIILHYLWNICIPNKKTFVLFVASHIEGQNHTIFFNSFTV